MANDIITIKEATQKQAGASLKFSYVDADGKRWCSWEPLQLSAGKTYELRKIETKNWSSKHAPDKEFTDYVIKEAVEVKDAPVKTAQPQANGTARPAQNGRQKWDKDEVMSARLSLVLGGWAQSGQIALDAMSVARALWALDEGKRLYETGTPSKARGPVALDTEDPSEGMEGTEFGR